MAEKLVRLAARVEALIRYERTVLIHLAYLVVRVLPFRLQYIWSEIL